MASTWGIITPVFWRFTCMCQRICECVLGLSICSYKGVKRICMFYKSLFKNLQEVLCGIPIVARRSWQSKVHNTMFETHDVIFIPVKRMFDQSQLKERKICAWIMVSCIVTFLALFGSKASKDIHITCLRLYCITNLFHSAISSLKNNFSTCRKSKENHNVSTPLHLSVWLMIDSVITQTGEQNNFLLDGW